jgi:hypothetical protein
MILSFAISANKILLKFQSFYPKERTVIYQSIEF